MGRSKDEIYFRQQKEVKDKIYEILDLDNNPEFTLYELDHNEELQEKLMELLPSIRKYFSYNSMKFAGMPGRSVRPWLGIMKQFTKERYILKIKKCRLYQRNQENETIGVIQTQRYTFIKK